MFPYAVGLIKAQSTGDVGLPATYVGPILTEFGTCLDATWPYHKSPFEKPSPAAYEEAKKYKVGGYRYLGVGDIKTSLQDGIPVMLSIMPTEDFGRAGSRIRNWREFDWDHRYSASNPFIGNHQVLIIGFDDAVGRYLCQNSWGSGWGDGGFFGIPYDKLPDVQTNLSVLENAGVNFLPAFGIGLKEKTPTSITATITPKLEDIGVEHNVWIAATIGHAWYMLTPDGWQEYKGDLQHAKRIKLARSNTIDVVSGMDLTPFVGVDVYLAYGQSPFDWVVGKVCRI